MTQRYTSTKGEMADPSKDNSYTFLALSMKLNCSWLTSQNTSKNRMEFALAVAFDPPCLKLYFQWKPLNWGFCLANKQCWYLLSVFLQPDCHKAIHFSLVCADSWERCWLIFLKGNQGVVNNESSPLNSIPCCWDLVWSCKQFTEILIDIKDRKEGGKKRRDF